MDAATLTALIKAYTAGAISHDTFLMNLKKGELMDVNRAFDDERDLIQEDDGILPFPSAQNGG